MALIVSLILLSGLITLLSKRMKKYPVRYYIGSGVFAVITVVILWMGWQMQVSPFVRNYVLGLMTNAVIGTSLFIIVMFTGAVPNHWKAYKVLMPIRAELSIMASLITLGHNIGYGKRYFVALFSEQPMPVNFYYASIISLILIALMLPLFITSFRCVRKKMKYSSWKNLQRFAYLFYYLIWIHVLLIHMPSVYRGSIRSWVTVIAYDFVFVLYTYMRCRKKSKKMAVFATPLALLIVVFSFLIGTFDAKSSTIVDTTQVTTLIEEIGTVEGIYMPGSYEASAYGYVGKVTVHVRLDANEIKSIEVVEHQEDEEYFEMAKEVIDSMLINNQADVDTVSGATFSSKAIIDAVKKALKQAVIQ